MGFSIGLLDVGVFAKLKAAGALNLASYKFDRCAGESKPSMLGSGSVAISGEIIAKVIAEPNDPYGIEATGGVSGGRTWLFDVGQSYASVTAYVKAEVKFDTRKYQLINLSQTWTDSSSFSAGEVAPEIESAIGATN